jgi:drug/metabolite transporter (DMT)-like permease
MKMALSAMATIDEGGARPSVRTLALVLTAGVLSVSAGSILARLSREAAGLTDPGYSLAMSGMRLSVASLLLLPAWRRVPGPRALSSAWRWSLLAGVFMAVHFAAWITSLSYTSITASTTIATSTPVWVALLSWALSRERPRRLTWIGIGVALAGGLLVGASSDGGGGTNPLLGDALAAVGAVTGSLYFLLGRRAQQAGFSIGSYAAVAYGTAALLLLPAPYLFGAEYTGHPAPAYFWIVLMALFPQLVGHTSFNWAVKWMSPVLVALVMLGEPIGASALGYLVFGEVPGVMVLAGALILLAGVALAIVGSKR